MKKTLLFCLAICFVLFFVAACGSVEFNVNFVVDGEVYSTISTSGKETIKIPENPTKDNYTFDGWFWDKDVWEKPFTANSLLDAPLSSDMSVYAKFTKKHTHDYTAQIVEPTCTEQGYTVYTCECGDSYTADYTNALNHDFGEWIVTTEPTCTQKGVETRYCSHDNNHTETREVNKLEHNYKPQIVKPTCTEQGYTVYTCECGDSYTADYTNALNHDFGEWIVTTEPTCTTKGEETRYCSHDNSHTEKREVSIISHSYTSKITAPTCTEQGYTTYTCLKCGNSYVDDYTEKLGHIFTNYVYDDNATYDEDGTKTAYCDRGCGAKNTLTDKGTKLKSGIDFKTLTVNETNVSGKVANSVTTYSFLNEIIIKGNATYTVNYDINCNQPIPSKTATLNLGNNVFYVLEKIDGEVSNLFTVTVRRREIYEVSFNTVGGTAVDNQQVEEDGFATAPITLRVGYTFTGWNYDFLNPIIKNTEITASWTANENTPYKVEYYLENLEDENYTLDHTDNLTGTTDTTATAEIKVFWHFTPISDSVTGNINGDGSTVLGVYYTRDIYNVTFDLNGGTLTTGTLTQQIKYQGNAIAPVFYRNGATFNRFDQAYTNISSDLTIKAVWDLTTYNITYILDIGTMPENVTTYTVDDDIVLNKPQEEYFYNFAWYNSNNALSSIKPDTIYGDITLKGKWLAGNKAFTIKNNSITAVTDYGKMLSVMNLNDCLLDKITSISDNAFSGCTNIKEIIICDCVTTIGSYAFNCCSNLSSITIPDSVTSIGNYAFNNCSSLTSVKV